MYVLGVVAATPDLCISGEEPRECAVSGSPIAGRAGVRAKRVSLPVEYIRSTGNADVLEGWKVATATPTSLGVQAVRDVLQRTGLSIEQVGLLLGDTGTPYQTCPSEAQRIAGELGVKIPAYDLVGGIGAVPHMFSVLSRWSAARLPEYLLYVSTNTPSQHAHYGRDPVAAGLFGDAAVALVLGKQRAASGPSVRVAYAAFRAEETRRTPIVIERSARVNTESLLSAVQIKGFIAAEMQRLQQFDATLSQKALFVAPQLYAAEAGESLTQYGVGSQQIISGVDENGFSLGSSHGVALTKSWSALQSGQPVVLMHCGDGQCGSVVLVAA
jgi:3-oxoacyl-[acyl-carrier-protein] synthase III